MLGCYGISGVHLALEPVDFRKSINGLSIIVQESFDLDPFDCSLYVFCNKNRDKIKILFWENNGFWLYYKRLEKGRFDWPEKSTSQKAIAVSERELSWLLDGLPMKQAKAHKPIRERLII